MGACQSCLGLASREENESEHAHLIDDDLYPGGYGYGSINNSHQQQSDPEDLKREREALEAICQRASETVIDIWAVQSQPHLQPRATLRSNESAGSSRVASNETRTPIDVDDAVQDVQDVPTTVRDSSSTIGKKPLTPVPNNWGEVVISPRRKKNKTEGGDIFDVLKV